MIKVINKDKILDLLPIYKKYRAIIDGTLSDLDLISTFVEETSSSICIGLYREDTIIGFIIFDNPELLAMYVEPRFRYYAPKLIEYFENLLVNEGLKFWTAECRTSKSVKAIEHFGGKVEFIKYYKEL